MLAISDIGLGPTLVFAFTQILKTVLHSKRYGKVYYKTRQTVVNYG